MLNKDEFQLNENHAVWLTEISEKDLSLLFKVARHNRLRTLDNAQVDLGQGAQIQNEIAALHRLEKLFLEYRAKAVDSEKKQEK